MAWLSGLIPPKIKALIKSSNRNEEVLWTKCPSCDKLVYNKDLKANRMVCAFCDHHFPLSCKERCKSIFDEEKFDIIASGKVKDDPIKFRDLKKYSDRLRESRQKTGLQDATIVAIGEIQKQKAVVFVMDFSFMGGSMGVYVGKSFMKAVSTAISENCPLISVTASGGARMQEGVLSLMQMPATIASLCYLKEKKLPFINLFTHPTTGGVLASFAMLGDINIAEPRALIGFAGARVIENTIKQKLPDEFQKSEFLLNHGMIDIIVKRNEMANTLGLLISYLTKL